jgi:hypothetical protein
MKPISIEFENSGFLYDRHPSDSFQLPNSLESIVIQPNELAVASTFNLKIKKLYDNFLYLYGLCFMSGFDLNENYKGWYDEIYGFNPKKTRDPLVATSGKTSALSSSNKAISFYDPSKPFFVNTIFTTNTTVGLMTFEKIIEDLDYLYSPLALTLTQNLVPGSAEYNSVVNSIAQRREYIDSYRANIRFTQTSIDPLSGSISFAKMGGVIQQNNENLFITDTVYNNIYSFNLKDAAGDDNIKQNILFQKNLVGGAGTVEDKIKFNSPTLLVNIDDHILVIDSKNSCFKVYDKNLNWVSTVTQAVFFKKYSEITAAAYHASSSKLILGAGQALHLFKIIDLDTIIFEKTVSIYISNDPTDKIIDLKFANYEDNILYVLTTKNIMKKWITKLEKNILYFGTPNNAALQYFWQVLSPYSKDIDIMLIRAGNNTQSLILVVEEGLSLKSLLKQDDFNVYSRNEVCLNGDEYNCAWTYNKSLKKLLYNLNLLASNITYRFYTKENEITSATSFIFKTYNNLITERVIKDTNKYSNIFVNENFQSEAINRCFNQLYDYQNYILTSLTNNTPFNVDLTPYRVM